LQTIVHTKERKHTKKQNSIARSNAQETRIGNAVKKTPKQNAQDYEVQNKKEQL
jgi:hypothetical protein